MNNLNIFLIIWALIICSENSIAASLCEDIKLQEVSILEKLSEDCCKVAKVENKNTKINSNKFNKDFENVFLGTIKEIDDQIWYLNQQSKNEQKDYSTEISRFEQYKKKILKNKNQIKKEVSENCSGSNGRNFSINIGMTRSLVNQFQNISYFNKSPDMTVNNIIDSSKNEFLPIRKKEFKEDIERKTADFGTFESKEVAASIVEQIEKRSDFGFCAINEREILKENIISKAPVEVLNFFGTQDFFEDNSASISKDSSSKLKNELSDLSLEAPIKVKIYTCSSMYKNCPEDNSPTCHSLSLMRKYTDESLLLSDKTPGSLKEVLSSSDYKKRIIEMKKSDFFQDPKEQRLWLALSMMRAISVKKEISTQFGNSSNLSFEMIPTGHPDDPFNNSKVDPALSGTCGPLPKQGQDSYYGNDDDKCEAKSFLIDKMKEHDMALSNEYKDLYSNYSEAKASSSLHRYVKVEFLASDIKKNKKGNLEKKKVMSYNVQCARMNNSCDQWKKEFKLPSINLPLIRIGSGKGNRGKTGCYF